MRRTGIFGAMVGFALMAAACGGDDEGMDEGMPPTDTMATEMDTAPAAGVTDAEIAAIVVAANEMDVQTGELAMDRAENEEVRQFAERMVTDHGTSNEQAGELASRLGVTPQPNETSEGIRDGGAQALERLGELEGAEFDRAYIEHEVAYHQQVLDAIDGLLLPNAQNAELRGLIEQTRPVIAAHLERARQLSETLGG